MEISTNQLTTATLEGITPTKVFVVEADTQTPVTKQDAVDTSDAVETVTTVEASVESTVQEKQKESKEKLQEAVTQINEHVQNLQRTLQFTVDEGSGKDVVTVLDSETEEVIRQYPSDEILEIARRLAEHQEDVISLFNSKA